MKPNQFLQFSKISFKTKQNLFLLNSQKPREKYNLESVINYNSSFTTTCDFCLSNTSQDRTLKIIQKLRSLRPPA